MKTQPSNCVSNLQQIGLAMKLYTSDFADSPPTHRGWADVGGQTPPTAAPDYSSDTPATNRPLNHYVGSVEVLRCPSDRGGFHIPGVIKNCYESYGNSYLVQCNSDAFGVKTVNAEVSEATENIAL